MPVTRRTFSEGLIALAATAGVSLLPVTSAKAQDVVDPWELATPVPLGDVIVGSASAPVTIVEYASLSCGHCAEFHKVTWPKIKAEYIDTNKVRFVFREFPLDIKAAAASMLARCSSKGDAEKYHEVAGLLFATQDEWVTRGTPEQLRHIVKKVGIDDDAFNTCIGDQRLVDGLQLGMQHAGTKLKVDSTPTFFINGMRIKGAWPFEEFRRAIEARLKS